MKRKFISLTLSAVLVLGVTTPAWAAAETYTDGEAHTIGVIVYDPDASEMEMFSDYYRDYIQAGFPVKFISPVRTPAQRMRFSILIKVKEQGAEESFFSSLQQDSGYHWGVREGRGVLCTWLQHYQ